MATITTQASRQGLQYAPALPDAIYLVECRTRINGKLASYYAERDTAAADRSTTISDIATGQLEYVHRVIEVAFDVPARDVTEDIACEVIGQLEAMPRGEHLRDFLECAAPEAWNEFCAKHREAA